MSRFCMVHCSWVSISFSLCTAGGYKKTKSSLSVLIITKYDKQCPIDLMLSLIRRYWTKENEHVYNR